MKARTVALMLGLVPVAVVVGYGVVLAVVVVVGTILGPFNPADDDTLRERIPEALAYLTGGATTLVILVVGWRHLSLER
jgi:hypothetical protein